MSCSSINSLRTLRDEQKKIEAQLTKKLDDQKATEIQLRKLIEEQKTELNANKLSEDQRKKLSAVNESEKKIKELESKVMGLKSELLRTTNNSGETEIQLKECKIREQELKSKLTQLEESTSAYNKSHEGSQANGNEMQLLQTQCEDMSNLCTTFQAKVDSLTQELKSKDELIEQQKAAKLDSEIDQGLVIIASVTSQLDSLELKAKEDGEVIAKLKLDLSQEQAKVQSFEQNAIVLSSQKRELTDELNTAQQKVQNLQQSMNTLTDQKKEITDKYDALKTEYDTKGNKYMEMAVYVTQIEQSMVWYQTYYTESQTQLQELTEKSTSLQSKLESLSSELISRDSRILQLTGQLKEESDQHNESKQQFQMDIENALLATSMFKEHLNKLEQKSKSDAAIVEQQAVVITQEKEKLQSLEQVIITLQSQRDSLTNEMKVNDDKRAEIEKSLTNQKEELESCKKSLKQWNDSWPVYEQNLMYVNSVLEQERQQYNAYISDLHAAAERLKLDLQKQSMSANEKLKSKELEVENLKQQYEASAKRSQQKHDEDLNVLKEKHKRDMHVMKESLQRDLDDLMASQEAQKKGMSELKNRFTEPSDT